MDLIDKQMKHMRQIYYLKGGKKKTKSLFKKKRKTRKKRKKRKTRKRKYPLRKRKTKYRK